METEYIKLDRQNPDRDMLKRAAQLLRQGEVVAFPTETVYGLGANALEGSAVKKIFIAKGRPSDNPLIVHISSLNQLPPLVKEIPQAARALMKKYWPGPLTLIFPKSEIIPPEITAGLETVAIRMPEHPVAQALIEYAGVPVAAPSANISGKPSPTSGQHVWQDMQGKVAMVLDSGETRVGVESTVLDITRKPPMILRPGGITYEDLQETLGQVELDQGTGKMKVPRSPGMKYTHYSPAADVFVVTRGPQSFPGKFEKAYRSLSGEGKKVAVLISEETAQQMGDRIHPHYREVLGSRHDLREVAHRLFSAFRNADHQGADIILIEEFSEEGMGAAVMNRMIKAAGNKVIN
ncbi:MAG: L-threonylcarbamoyladenylate synthase [Desulfitobacteriaceae bacterium]|nr:L-threonylcarbamoyladenylate synthase [Desulfitobacteriaceae bacterium]